MQNNEYDMLGDSVVYNTESDFAEFFTNTHIWNKGEGKPNNEQEYLFADRGSFDKAKQLYKLDKRESDEHAAKRQRHHP